MKDIEKRITKLWHFTSSTQVPVKSRITRLQTGEGRTFSATTHDTDDGSFADCTLFGPTYSACQVTNLGAMSLHPILPTLLNHHFSVANKSTPFSDCLSSKFHLSYSRHWFSSCTWTCCNTKEPVNWLLVEREWRSPKLCGPWKNLIRPLMLPPPF